MPRGDGTGPAGEGPMTGRAAGYCAGNVRPGFADSAVRRVGAGSGRPGGRGFGHRNRFYATGVPFSGYPATEPEPWLPRDEEITLLKEESQRLRSVLETIERRLAQIEIA
jgi:hypothetical protein